MSRVPLSDDEFTAITQLLHDTAGLAFDASRRESLAYSVGERMRAIGVAEVSAYLAMVIDARGSGERQALLDEVTIPETHFFRNPPQIRALRKYVLPELLKPNADPHLPSLFFDERYVTKLSYSRVTRFLRRHAALDVVLRLPLNVVANILVEFFQHSLAAAHDLPPCFAGRRMRAIAPASLSHLPVSSVSCRRPLAVRR